MLVIGPPVWKVAPEHTPSGGYWCGPDGAPWLFDFSGHDARSAFGTTDGQQGAGFGLFDLSAPVDGYVPLGDDASAAIGPRLRQEMGTRLGLSGLAGSTVMEIYQEISLTRTDPTGQALCMPRRPGRDGLIKFHLGRVKAQRRFDPNGPGAALTQERLRNEYRVRRAQSLERGDLIYRKWATERLRSLGMREADVEYIIPPDLPVEAPLRPSTDVSDDFGRADSDTPGASWVEQRGDWDVSSNTMLLAGAIGTQYMYWNATLSSDDHYAETPLVTPGSPAAGSYLGPICRNPGSATFTYVAAYMRFAANQTQTWRYTAGSPANVGTNTSDTYTSGKIVKLETDGDNYIRYYDATLRDTHDDSPSTITGNNYVGMGGIETGGSTTAVSATWRGGDLAAGGPTGRGRIWVVMSGPFGGPTGP